MEPITSDFIGQLKTDWERLFKECGRTSAFHAQHRSVVSRRRLRSAALPYPAGPPDQLGSFQWSVEDSNRWLEATEALVAFTRIQNVTGQPAMSVPLFWNEKDIPIGVHFAGRFGDEATLFQLAGQLEMARPWSGQYHPYTAIDMGSRKPFNSLVVRPFGWMATIYVYWSEIGSPWPPGLGERVFLIAF